MATSLDIAEMFGKNHKNVLRRIRDLLKKTPELSELFILSEYTSVQNKRLPMYRLTARGEELLIDVFKYNIKNARFEYKVLNEIEDCLDVIGINYKEQYAVSGYRTDLYLPDYNVVVEIDEIEHKYKCDYDTKRERDIVSEIGCKFFRVKESDNKSIGVIVGEFLKFIENS